MRLRVPNAFSSFSLLSSADFKFRIFVIVMHFFAFDLLTINEWKLHNFFWLPLPVSSTSRYGRKRTRVLLENYVPWHNTHVEM